MKALMDEDHRLLNEMDRARQAQDLIEHPLFKEALDTYRQRLTTEWADSPARDTQGRETLWLMLKTADAVQRHLTQIMETGHLASLQMEQKRSMLQKARAWTGLD